jgi:hypothetical protein
MDGRRRSSLRSAVELRLGEKSRRIAQSQEKLYSKRAPSRPSVPMAPTPKRQPQTQTMLSATISKTKSKYTDKYGTQYLYPQG